MTDEIEQGDEENDDGPEGVWFADLTLAQQVGVLKYLVGQSVASMEREEGLRCGMYLRDSFKALQLIDIPEIKLHDLFSTTVKIYPVEPLTNTD